MQIAYLPQQVALHNHKAHTVILSGNTSYAMLAGTLGNTNCCGSFEISGAIYIVPALMIELVKKSYKSVWLFHGHSACADNEWNSKSDVKEFIRQVNAKLQHCKIHAMMTEFSQLLVTLEILDREKFLEWRQI